MYFASFEGGTSKQPLQSKDQLQSGRHMDSKSFFFGTQTSLELVFQYWTKSTTNTFGVVERQGEALCSRSNRSQLWDSLAPRSTRLCGEYRFSKPLLTARRLQVPHTESLVALLYETPFINCICAADEVKATGKI